MCHKVIKNLLGTNLFLGEPLCAHPTLTLHEWGSTFWWLNSFCNLLVLNRPRTQFLSAMNYRLTGSLTPQNWATRLEGEFKRTPGLTNAWTSQGKPPNSTQVRTCILPPSSRQWQPSKVGQLTYVRFTFFTYVKFNDDAKALMVWAKGPKREMLPWWPTSRPTWGSHSSTATLTTGATGNLTHG